MNNEAKRARILQLITEVVTRHWNEHGLPYEAAGLARRYARMCYAADAFLADFLDVLVSRGELATVSTRRGRRVYLPGAVWAAWSDGERDLFRVRLELGTKMPSVTLAGTERVSEDADARVAYTPGPPITAFDTE